MSSEQEPTAFVPEQQMVKAGIDTAEQYANTGNIVELDGVHLANTAALYGMRRFQQRRKYGIPTGRLTVQHEIPLILT